MSDHTIAPTTRKPQPRGPADRIQTRDSVGKLKYVGRTTWYNNVTHRHVPRMQVLCDPELGGCGNLMEWASQEFARRRRRWARLGLEPQCRLCEERNNPKHPTRERPLWERNADVAARDKLRTTWLSMQHERVRQDRNLRGNWDMTQLLYGQGFCDPLQFHVDRRWTSVFEGNPDPFETFLFDMGVPPDSKPYLLRRDPYGPMCKDNCYWGDAGDRRNNRSDNLTALRALGVRIVALPPNGVPDEGPDVRHLTRKRTAWERFLKHEVVLMPYAVVQGSKYDPRATHGGVKAWFAGGAPVVSWPPPRHRKAAA